MSIPTVLDRFPTPPCAILLGLDIRSADRPDGRVEIRFVARPEFCNAAGNVQGGFLSAMLDDCMGPAVLIATDARIFPSTMDLHVQFLAPAKPGPIVGKARIIRLGKTIGFVEAELDDGGGMTIARATASVRITAMRKATASIRRDYAAIRRKAVNLGSPAKNDISSVKSPRSTRHAI